MVWMPLILYMRTQFSTLEAAIHVNGRFWPKADVGSDNYLLTLVN